MQNRRILQRNVAEAGVTITPKLESDTISVLYVHVSVHNWSTVITEAWLKALVVPDGMRAIPMDKPRRSYLVGMVLADQEPAPPTGEPCWTSRNVSTYRESSPRPAHPYGRTPGRRGVGATDHLERLRRGTAMAPSVGHGWRMLDMQA